MGNIFAGSEIVEIGVQIEINGRDFYNALVKKSKKKETGDIFGYLAGEEEKHIATFQKLLDSVNKYEPQEAYPQEYFTYMNALAKEHVFTKKDKGAEIAKNIKSDEEALDMGIGFEKDSIVFYEGMKKVVPEYDHKTLDGLIEEEKKHLRDLNSLKKKLGG